MLTPFLADGSLDEAAVCRLVDHIIGGGCQGILAAGTTGEAASMTIGARVRLLQVTAQHTGGRALLFGGIGDNSFGQAVEMADAYFRAGVDAVVAHLPSYYPMQAPEMERYFMGLADRVAGPMYIYNIPQTTRQSVPLDILERLSHHPRIRGVKDSEPDEARQRDVASRFADRDDFAVFCGSIPFSEVALQAGADGYIPSAGNVAPRLVREVMDRWLTGDADGTRSLLQRVGTVSALYQRNRSLAQSLAAMKAMLEARGIALRHVLPPLIACTDAELLELRRQMETAIDRPDSDETLPAGG